MQFIGVIAVVFGGILALVSYGGARAPTSQESAIQLCQAVDDGDLDRLQEMMRNGADPNQDDNGFTPLYYATVFGLDRAATMLVLGGADVNRVEQNGFTPSMVAAARGNNAVLSVLIRAGADVNFVAADGASALKNAMAGRHPETVRLLIRAGAKSAV